jgi:hypothetical protein
MRSSSSWKDAYDLWTRKAGPEAEMGPLLQKLSEDLESLACDLQTWKGMPAVGDDNAKQVREEARVDFSSKLLAALLRFKDESPAWREALRPLALQDIDSTAFTLISGVWSTISGSGLSGFSGNSCVEVAAMKNCLQLMEGTAEAAPLQQSMLEAVSASQNNLVLHQLDEILAGSLSTLTDIAGFCSAYKKARTLQRKPETLELMSDAINLTMKVLAIDVVRAESTLDTTAICRDVLAEAYQDEKLLGACRNPVQMKNNIKGFQSIVEAVLKTRKAATAFAASQGQNGISKSSVELDAFQSAYLTQKTIMGGHGRMDGPAFEWFAHLRDNTLTRRDTQLEILVRYAGMSLDHQLAEMQGKSDALHSVAGGGEDGVVWHATLPEAGNILEHFALTLSAKSDIIEKHRLDAAKDLLRVFSGHDV